MIDINKFLQLNNPDIARQTRNMSYFDALKSEIPGTKSYQGYNPFYKGADKTGLGGYLKQGVNSVQGKFTPGSNVGGATPLTRKLAQDTMRLGIGASQAGRSVLGRVLGAALGPAAGYASALAAPNMYMASMLDGPNVRSGAADEYVGMMGEAMPEEDYAGLADLLGMPEASQALDDEYYKFDELPSTRQASSPRALGAEDIKEEGIFSLGDILADLGRKGVEGFKDVAGRSIASQALGGVGTMLTGNPLIGGIASLAGLLTGGNMFNQSYDNSFKEFATPDMSPYGMGSPGLSHLQDKYGKNTVSARGNYGKMALDTFFNLTERSKKGPMGKHLQDKKDYYGNIVNKINSKLTDANDYGSGVDGDTTASGGPQSMGSAKGGAGGRPY